jgi:hypothetical protein
MKSKIISIVLLATLMLSMAAIFPIHADVGDVTFTVTPTNNDYIYPDDPVGSRFNITVMWTDQAPLVSVYAWQVILQLNDTTLLNCTRAWVPTWNANYLLVSMLPNEIDATSGEGTGEISAMGSGKGAVSPVSSASAMLCIFELEIMRNPTTPEAIYCSLTIDNADTQWSPDGGVWNDPIRTGGMFTYSRAAPGKPHLEVHPASSSLIFGPAACVGDEFDVEVWLMAIDELLDLQNVSFTLTYDCSSPLPAQILEIAGYTVHAFWATPTVNNATAGFIDVFVVAPTAPSGDKLIVTITFRIIYQGAIGDPTETAPLVLSNIVLWGPSDLIDTDDPVDSLVTVLAYSPFAPPHFEVSSPILDTADVGGLLFNVTVSIKELSAAAYFIGYDFRLGYNTSLITPVTAYEGPFLPGFSALQPGSMGTWWTYYLETDGGYGPHVLAGGIILPNDTGLWGEPFPEGDGVVATITFMYLGTGPEQSFGEEPITIPDQLYIIEEDWIGLDNLIAQNVVDLPYNDPVNGSIILSAEFPNTRVIDLYDQYPAPFGGQGWNMPSDMFWPQKQIELYANVTYNYWPVQQKDVAFEVRDPHGTLVTIQVARTDANGIAHTWYRIPWPCDHPEDLFGVWTVTATVDLACIIINDTMQFHFDYLVEIFKITTNKFQVNHYECFNVIIDYGSHAQQEYPVVIQAILYDNLDVPVIQGFFETTVGGTQFCQYKNNTVTIPLCIPKYAYAGIAKIYVNAYSALPTQGGIAWCPTYGLMNPFGYSWPIGSTVPVVAIQPR